MSVVAQILRAQNPSAGERIASLLPGYQPDTTYPEEIQGAYHNFPDADDLREFFRSSEFHNARSQGAQITILQINGSSVWIKYPRGSLFYQNRLRQAIRIKNERKKKKLFFARLGKLLLATFLTPKQALA